MNISRDFFNNLPFIKHRILEYGFFFSRQSEALNLNASWNLGVRGGPLFDTTRAWFHFLRAIVSVMKRGYSNCHSEIITDEGASDVDVDLAEDFRKMGSRDR